MLTRAGLLITVLFSVVCSYAQMGSNPRSLVHAGTQLNLTVTVRTAKGAPAANARVELRELNNGTSSISGYTNGLGIAELPNVSGGTYEVVATYQLTEVRQRANLSFGESTLALILPQGDATGADIGSNSSVSVAEYQVPSKARKEFKKAQEALQNKKVEDSIAHLDKAVQLYPLYADALALRGIIRMDKKDTEGALSDLDAAIKADSSCSLAYFAIGATFNSLDRFDDAVRSLQRGLTLDPKSWQGYFELGKAFVGKGEYKEGITQLEKSEGLAPGKYPPIHLVKAHALLATKDYSLAMKELQDFISEAPNDSRAANVKATLDKVSTYVDRGAIAQK